MTLATLKKPRLKKNMKRHSLIIVNRDKNNLEVLKNNFLEAYYEVDLAYNDTQAMHMVSKKRYDAMMTELSAPGIDGYSLLEMVQKSALNAATPVIFLTTKSDVWNRVKSLQLGAKDYIIKPIHVKELVARVNMLIARIERKSEEEQIVKKKFTGKLEDISVFDLIKVFGLEKKTGILSLFKYNGYTGQIFFENGNIINAGTLLLNGEKAVFKMMTWTKGLFSMHFCDIDVIDEIKMSNLAILLQGAMRMELSEKIQNDLPSLDAIITTTSNFQKITAKQELKNELQQFLELFDGKRNLGQIIDDSKSDEIETMQRIKKLLDMGFLNIKDDNTELEELEPENLETPFENITPQSNPLLDDLLNEDATYSDQSDTDDLNTLPARKEKLFEPLSQSNPVDIAMKSSPDTSVSPVQITKTLTKEKNDKESIHSLYKQAKGTVLIISKDHDKSKTIVDNLSISTPVLSNVNIPNVSDIYFGTASFKGDALLNLATISTDKEFDPLLDYFSSKTLGYVLLVDIQRANWNYYHYLLNVLRRKLSVPTVIVISNKGLDSNSITIDGIRSKLMLRSNEKIMFCSDYNQTNAKKIIISLFKNYFK